MYKRQARGGAVPHHIQQGGNVSIKPRADILDIIDHGIYQVQHLRRHVLGILAVQAVHRQSGGGIGVGFHGSTGVMVAAYAVLPWKPTPVSYTHLDVYKRQVQQISHCLCMVRLHIIHYENRISVQMRQQISFQIPLKPLHSRSA